MPVHKKYNPQSGFVEVHHPNKVDIGETFVISVTITGGKYRASNQPIVLTHPMGDNTYFRVKCDYHRNILSVMTFPAFQRPRPPLTQFKPKQELLNSERNHVLQFTIKKGEAISATIDGGALPNLLDAETIDIWFVATQAFEAMESGMYIEAISLYYLVLLYGIQYAIMGNSKRLNIGPDEIEEAKKITVLRDLSKIALNMGIYDNALHIRICEFNKVRGTMVHRLGWGDTKGYKLRDIKDQCDEAAKIYGDLQKTWLTWKVGATQIRTKDGWKEVKE